MENTLKFYVVLDDCETFTENGFIVFDEDLSTEQRERVEDCDGKVFKDPSLRRIELNDLLSRLQASGLLEQIMNEMKS